MADSAQPGILLIADDYDEATQTERVLRKYRIANRVERVRDCDEGLKLLRGGFSTEAQLALLDYSAPGMPAPEAIVRMRGLPGLDQMPVIVCCGNPEEERLVKGLNMKRVACMSKPAGFFKLLECIQRLEMHWYVFGSRPG
jgi:DNA-binding response OmpR family regulator